MTIKTLTGVYAATYNLSAAYSELDLSATAGVTGTAGVNGSRANPDGTAGSAGVEADFAATLRNSGAITGGQGGYGFTYRPGAGGAGVGWSGGVISNSGTIVGGLGGSSGLFGQGASGGAGILLFGAGTVTNTGVVSGGKGGNGGAGMGNAGFGGIGGYGVLLISTGLVTNLGVISGGAAGRGGYGGGGGPGAVGVGVELAAGGTLVNGSKSAHSAQIAGRLGVYASGGATIMNFGTISGTIRGVLLETAADRMVAEVGSTVIGDVRGSGGVLEIAGGKGTISGLGSAAYGTLSGAASMSFVGFGSYLFDKGSAWTLAGPTGISTGQTINTAGSLTVTGSINNAGLLEATGHGSLVLKGATIGNVAGEVLAATGASVTLQGVTIYGGEIATTGTGKVQTGAGSNLLDGITNAVTSKASLIVSDNTSLFVEGAITNQGVLSLAASTHTTILRIATAVGATLSGAGSISMGPSVGNTIVGVDTNATLTNIDNTISGGGQIGAGQLTLINRAAGVIDQTGATALTIDTGAQTIANAGLIEATGTGGLTIASAIANTGTLAVAAGVFTVKGAVTGTGLAVINGGTLAFTASFKESVVFAGTTGTLSLAKSSVYSGSVSGFSKTGGTTLDLRDIVFTAGVTNASYSGTTAGGTLTVTDGTHTAKIKLVGDYTHSTFVTATDGSGGTLIHDPSAPAAPSSALPYFISAMASVKPSGGALLAGAIETRGQPIVTLAAGRTAFS